MNKLKLLTSVALMLIVSIGISQNKETDFREKLKLGLKIGANYSNVYNSEGEEFTAEGKLGFTGGAFFSIPISKYIGIQPEILLSQKGFKGSGTFLSSSYELKRTTTHLDIPLFFSFKPSEFFTLQAGPQFSYLLKQKDSFSSTLLNVEQEEKFSNDNLNSASLQKSFNSAV